LLAEASESNRDLNGLGSRSLPALKSAHQAGSSRRKPPRSSNLLRSQPLPRIYDGRRKALLTH
jgi:hypothetical protein